jgi:hypothetical protein|tara:strand:+ start:1291 stop:1614 length:324 start_codon:yes stop_codon:yes gene_type:complete
MKKDKNITEHFNLITDVLNRVDKLKQEYDLSSTPDRMTLHISLEYANLSINELKNLLSFDNGSFGHDVFGIDKYMCRDTYKLTDCFLPRCSLRGDDSYRNNYKGCKE